jgi:hypothetical protein
MLGQYAQVLSAGEIFHHTTSYGGFEHFHSYRDWFSARIGLPADLDGAERDAAISAWTHAHPRETVQALLDFAAEEGKAYAMFQVFPGHLMTWQLDRIIGKFRPEVVLLTRTPLDAYVSLQKANALKRWMKADTTGVRVRLDPDDFVAWHDKVSAFYRFAIHSCLGHGLHPRIIRYDDLYKAQATPQEVLESIFRQMGIELQAREVKGLKVQDRGGDVHESIENRSAFLSALWEAGKAHMLYQFELFGRLSYFEYAAKSLLGPLRLSARQRLAAAPAEARPLRNLNSVGSAR